ncbi:MAG: dihydrodipicolinate synthase family protein [Chloroflexi bacterium]|nr:dihydrodipicolinate synthase family protein [Chloroflexota bacterium]
MNFSRKEKLVGVVVSLPTFTDADHHVLLEPLRKHVRWLVEKGLRTGSAVLMGSAGLGEGYFLSHDEFCSIVDVLADAAAGRVPTMVGIFELSAREAARKASYAAKAGIDFVQLALPHYMAPSEQDVLNHFRYVNDAADIGLVAYNIPWAMPAPGFELTANILEQFTHLENVVGVKWSCNSIWHYLRMLRLFRDRLNFIDNMIIMSLGMRLGARGFIDWYANAAPNLSLKFWELLKAGKYDEYDTLYLKLRFDPSLAVVNPEQQSWIGMGEGPTARQRLRLLGLDSGPSFPAQEPMPPSYDESVRRGIESSGILEWVEWTPEVIGGPVR